VSKFDLRDISDRLTKSRDTEAVVFEFLGYLQAVRADWRASLAFYEVSRDALVNTYQRHGNRLIRRDIVVPVDQLPARLVRKFFHPSAFFNHTDRRSALSHLFGASPSYAPDPLEAPALSPLAPHAHWQSCLCVPLADQEDMFALLVLVSEKRNAFGSRALGDIIPVKSIAALALSQHLYRGTRERDSRDDGESMHAAATEFQQRLQHLDAHAAELERDNRVKTRELEALAGEIEQLDRNSSEYRQELERVKGAIFALEEQSAAATQHLTDAYSQLNVTQARLVELQRTVGFLREIGQVLSRQHEPADLPGIMTTWFGDQFGVERCSLMLLEPSGETLVMSAQRGIDPQIASQVRVRVGQGVAGWVAHNRKPLLVRVSEDARPVSFRDREAYNSDSFISVPMVYGDRMVGVLNLSNKRAGEPFDEMDLDRAMLAGTMTAMVLGAQETVRRAAVWK
jgi:GAF domain-containing protein